MILKKGEIHEIEQKTHRENEKKTESCFFKIISNIDKFLARLTKKERIIDTISRMKEVTSSCRH